MRIFYYKNFFGNRKKIYNHLMAGTILIVRARPKRHKNDVRKIDVKNLSFPMISAILTRGNADDFIYGFSFRQN
jgi:hypothetical protein